MNKLFIFVLGIGIGAGTTYVIMTREDERELIIHEPEEDIEDGADVMQTDEGVIVEKLTKQYKSTDTGEAEHINYNDTVDVDEDEPPESEWPYLIGEKMYKQECVFYEKKVLYYHAKDGILTDEDYNAFNNPELVIDAYGYIEFDDFFDVNIPDAFFVRNDAQETDYQIFWLFEDSFNDLIEG